MNLIYLCVFFQKEYIKLLSLLINSINLCYNINKEVKTDILILTSYDFQPLIDSEISKYNLPIKYFIFNVNSLFQAGCARLNIFNYENINTYENILYLDADILINGNLDILFNLNINDNDIYAFGEGNLYHECWGGQLVDKQKYNDALAFNTGILYFKNSIKIKTLFEDIKGHINEYTKNHNIPICLDQPFIVYNSFIKNQYNNQLLNKYIENNPTNINNNILIYHFHGGPGHYQSKLYKMNTFFPKLTQSKIR